jgi:transketolase
LPQLEGSTIEKTIKGAYVLHESSSKADLTFVATGSEVALAVDAAKILESQGKSVRVVSMPCCEVFDQQSREYQLSVLPDGAPIISVEAYSVSLVDRSQQPNSSAPGR